ncbi:MAG: hypothetical protein ACOY6N_01420 [Pseudomonadota bacterium]|uniref:hypothetical protein n=1 Tax=Tepidiphilus succinatimandens TaxID=224436 RepID=UPI00112F1893|nr:hypothetical protein [Tepidiphilus succinatimandens]
MADDADRAQDRMEWEESLRRRMPLPQGPKPTGYCLWCESTLPPDRRWCDADCRDHWQRYQRADGRLHQ